MQRIVDYYLFNSLINPVAGNDWTISEQGDWICIVKILFHFTFSDVYVPHPDPGIKLLRRYSS